MARGPVPGRVFSRRESSSRSPTSSCSRSNSRCNRSTSRAFWLFTWAARLSPTSSRAVRGVFNSWATSLTQRSCCSSWASRERRLCSCTTNQPSRPGTTMASRSWPPECNSSRWGRSWRRAMRMLLAKSGSGQTSPKGWLSNRRPASSCKIRSALGLIWPIRPWRSRRIQPMAAESIQLSSCRAGGRGRFRPARRRQEATPGRIRGLVSRPSPIPRLNASSSSRALAKAITKPPHRNQMHWG